MRERRKRFVVFIEKSGSFGVAYLSIRSWKEQSISAQRASRSPSPTLKNWLVQHIRQIDVQLLACTKTAKKELATARSKEQTLYCIKGS
jgi:hypothetical protein